MAIKPFDSADLRKVLSAGNDKIAALSDAAWVSELSEAEVLKAVRRGTPELREQVARSAHSSKVLGILARDGDDGVRYGVAENCAAPAELLGALARDSELDVRRRVAENPSAPPEVLGALARDSHVWVCQIAARNPSMPPDLLDALAKHADGTIRSSVAWNTSTPPEVLGTLAKDADSGVRCSAAGNRSTPIKSLRALARDGHEEVRKVAAENPSTPAGAKPGCFIATAAFGSCDAPVVMSLRRFRDELLLAQRPGRQLVEMYYRLSPPVAVWIAKHLAVRQATKWLLVIPAAMVARVFLRLWR